MSPFILCQTNLGVKIVLSALHMGTIIREPGEFWIPKADDFATLKNNGSILKIDFKALMTLNFTLVLYNSIQKNRKHIVLPIWSLSYYIRTISLRPRQLKLYQQNCLLWFLAEESFWNWLYLQRCTVALKWLYILHICDTIKLIITVLSREFLYLGWKTCFILITYLVGNLKDVLSFGVCNLIKKVQFSWTSLTTAYYACQFIPLNVRFTGKWTTISFNEVKQSAIQINVSSPCVVRVFIHASVHCAIVIVFRLHQVSFVLACPSCGTHVTTWYHHLWRTCSHITHSTWDIMVVQTVRIYTETGCLVFCT